MALFELNADNLDKKLKLRLAKSLTKENKFNFKERFNGLPKSVMHFQKSPELMQLIQGDKSELNDVVNGSAKARGGGYAANIKYSTYNPDQAYFIIDYYTEEKYTILDPFMGRFTRPLISLLLNRNYIGFDTCSKTVEMNRILIEKYFKNANYELYHSDGTELANIKNRSIDAVFSCPPYYDKEVYSGEYGDLSHMNYRDFDARISSMFYRLKDVIKLSDYKNYKFYPVIFTVGTHRFGDLGLIDMEYLFNRCAFENGFVLHDKLITENNAPGLAYTFKRNYKYKFLAKTHETTLIYLLYK